MMPKDIVIGERVHLYHSKRLSPQMLHKRIAEAIKLHTTSHEILGDVPPLIIIDTSSANLDMKDENSNSQVSEHMAKLKELYEVTKAPIWITAHLSKTAKGATIDELANLSARGGGAWEGDANWTAVVGRSEDSAILKIDKERVGGLRGREVRFTVTPQYLRVLNRLGDEVDVNYPVVGMEVLGEHERYKEMMEVANQGIIDFITEHEYPSQQKIIDGIKGKTETIRQSLDFLVKTDRVIKAELPKDLKKGNAKFYFTVPEKIAEKVSAKEDFGK